MQQREAILKALGRRKKTEGTDEEPDSQAQDLSAKDSPAQGSQGASKTDAPGRAKVEAFRQVLDQQRDICWQDLVPQFRETYYDAYEEVSSAMFSTDDPLVVYNLVRYADFSRPQEIAAHVKFIRECDAEKHQVALRALARTKVPELIEAIQQRDDLPETVSEALPEVKTAKATRKSSSSRTKTSTEDAAASAE